jgi:hypothetical protein
MRIAAEAWRLREAARGAIAAGEYERAAVLAGGAQDARATPAGGMLLRLGVWLSRGSEGTPAALQR